MKKDYENEFRGSKIGGGRYGSGWEVWFAGPIRARPAAVFHDFWPARSPHLAHPPWPTRVQ